MNIIRNGLIAFLLLTGFLTIAHAKEKPTKDLFALKPGNDPVLFAPGFISTGLYVRDTAISPDYKEFYFTVMTNTLSKIIVTKKSAKNWTPPEVASFSSNTDYGDVEPHITPDGNHLYFLSTRPLPGKEYKPGWQNQNLWGMDKTDTGWSEPYPLPSVINNGDNVFFPSVTSNGTLYFCREKQDTRETYIYRSIKVTGTYTEPELLPKQVNSTTSQFNACIAPDESYIIICTSLLKDKIGFTDYYVVFRSKDDQWSEPINLGNTINKPGAQAVSPYITSDGKYFFFASNMMKSLPNPISMEILQKMNNEPQNGRSALYWVSTEIIEKLRPKGF